MESKSFFFCVAQLVWCFGAIIFSPGVDLTVWWCWMKLKRLMPRRHELVELFFFPGRLGQRNGVKLPWAIVRYIFATKNHGNQCEPTYGIRSVFHGLPAYL